MTKKDKTLELLMTPDGRFWFGSQKKDGSLTASSVELDDDTIYKLIAAFFENRCKKEGTDTMLIQNPAGVIVMKQVLIKDVKEAIQKKAKEAIPTRRRKTTAKKNTKTCDN